MTTNILGHIRRELRERKEQEVSAIDEMRFDLELSGISKAPGGKKAISRLTRVRSKLCKEIAQLSI